jgi:hypothetical protein
MFLLTYFGISCSFKFAPLKIKVLSLSALAVVSFRYIALIIFLVTPNIKNLYLLKPFMFLDLLCLPVLAIVSTYIFGSNDRIKFNYCIIISILFLLAYTAAVVILPINIKIYGSLGYIMSFNNELLVYGIYLIINTIFLFTAMLFLGNKISNKLGVWFVLASAFTVIAELITRTSGLSILPAVLFGDIIWVITADYALYKLKK